MKHTIRKFKKDRWGVLVEDIKSVKCELGSGLFDKGGSEIIEGDIVMLEQIDYTVTFHDGAFYLTDPVEEFPLSAFCPAELEIVGHIEETEL